MITSFFKAKSSKKGPVSVSTPKREREGFEDNAGGNKKRAKDNADDQDQNDENSLPLDVQELVKSLNSEEVIECDPSNEAKDEVEAEAESNKNDSQLQEEKGPTVTWRKALDKHISSSSFARLAKFVAEERKSSKVIIYPPVQDTFSALTLTPLDQVKVVIVGQDPYHGPNQAHGLCFSVRKGVKIPPSLLNMYKELVKDEAVEEFTTMPPHGFLERWAKQGVLMMNNVLTVRKGDAHSHAKKGWEAVTDEIIRAVDRASRARNTGVVFLLWGKPATTKAQTILQCSSSSSRHKIICTSHPSPLGATKTKAPFMGSKCFSRANQALKELGHEPVDWRVDGELA